MMKLELLPDLFTVCQVSDEKGVDLRVPFTFFSRTDEESSLVCPVSACPPGAVSRQDGWRCLRVPGPLDFSLTGILARIAGVLAEEKIPIFALSTYNTDYVLIREEWTEKALAALAAAGYELLLPSGFHKPSSVPFS